MTKSELIQALAEKEGISLRAAEIAVDTTFKSMADVLVGSGRIEIRNFGTFKVKVYDGYPGHNPKTGEKIQVQAKKLPFFKLGKGLKERLNDFGAAG